MRAGCGDKSHVRFGRGGLVFLSYQDLAFYLTSNDGGKPRTWRRGAGIMEEPDRKVCEMRTAETILGLIRERGKKGLPLERVYKLLST